MLSSEAGRWQVVFSKIPYPKIYVAEVGAIERLMQCTGGSGQRQNADRARAIFPQRLRDFVRR